MMVLIYSAVEDDGSAFDSDWFAKTLKELVSANYRFFKAAQEEIGLQTPRSRWSLRRSAERANSRSQT
jgi:hypothetical protein